MITHSVFMKLKYASGSAQEKVFMERAEKLADIPGVLNYRIVKETSPKNDFEYGLVMQFESQKEYDSYNDHPEHSAFVEEVWIPNVATFQEIDYQQL